MDEKQRKYGWNILYPEEKDDKKYHIPKPPRRPRYDDDADQLKKFIKKLNFSLNEKTSHHKNHTELNHTEQKVYREQNGSTGRKQRCTVKCNYGKSKASHLKFLRCYMPQKNKEEVENKPTLFGNISEAEYKEKAVDKHFKFIISPEKVMDSKQLETFIRYYMDKMERRTGKKYDWQAVVHTNTPHPHAHIVINGVDKDGNDVIIPKDYIKSTARQDAEDFLTGMFGERTKEEIKVAKNFSITTAKWTALDEKIFRMVDDNMTIKNVPLTLDIERRLSFLKSLDLASWNNGEWKLDKKFKEKLLASGRYNMFLDARFFVHPDCELHLYKSEMGTIQGKIRHIYKMDDEGVWTNAVVVESKEQQCAWYIPVYSAEVFKTFEEGQEIIVKCKTNTKGKLSPCIYHKKDYGKTRRYYNKSY